MKTWDDIIAFFVSLSPPFFASLIGALMTLLNRVRKERNQVKDILLEALFCVPFGTLLGFVTEYFAPHSVWTIIAASLGGMFGEKIYGRMAKRMDTIDAEEFIVNPLSILSDESDNNEHKNDNNMRNGKGYFLGIGLNSVSPDEYEGWTGDLKGCENDIEQLEKLATMKGFLEHNRTTFLTENATLLNVRRHLVDLKSCAQKGDTVWIAYSGHGNQTQNGSGRPLETYCLFDGQMADFEMLNQIAGFDEGVSVILTLDCCHSGGFGERSLAISATGEFREKSMPKNVAMNLQTLHFQAIKEGVDFAAVKMKGGQELVIVCACQKNEKALDGDKNGLFTAAMLKAHLTEETANYADFVKQIAELSSPYQKPRLIERPKKGNKLVAKAHFTI